MTPADFLNEIALPAALDFKSDPRSRRFAYQACINTFHIKDHRKQSGATSIETLMRAKTGYMFDVVRGICNGTKHVQTDGSHIVAFKAGDDTDRSPGILGEMILDESILEDTVGGRNILTPGGPVDVYEAVAAVLHAYVDAFPQHFSSCDLSAL